MRESTALMKEFDQSEGVVAESGESVGEVFSLPVRNWNLIIDSYNAVNKRKFYLTPLECRMTVEFVKKGIPPQHIFQSIGVSPQRYTSLVTKHTELESRLVELSSLESQTDAEYEEFQTILRHPARILMSDINRAQGISDIQDWERYNNMAATTTDMQAMKMRAKFRDFFEGKDSSGAGHSIVINLGGDFISEL